MTDKTLVSKIDNEAGELERTIAQILGVSADTDVTVSAFLLDNDGRVTRQLVRFDAVGKITSSAASRVGLQITNEGN